MAIRAGRHVVRRQESGGESWEMLDTGDAEATDRALLAMLAARGYDPAQDVVISPVNGQTDTEAASVAGLNRQIVAMINPHAEGKKWKVGDRVMNMENDYEADWMNGDTGTVADVDDRTGRPIIATDRERDGWLRCTGQHTGRLVHAYAITCHKAQGSQYRNVYIPLLYRHSRMLSRPWLYTAVTRARRSVVLLGQIGIVRRAVSNLPTKRTALQQMLGGAQSEDF
jgi:exodeoxyribonuclease V alpha subunit